MFLVDTNILSELSRKRPNPQVLTWVADQESLALAAVTIQEIAYGALIAPTAERSAALTAWLESLLANPAFQILAFDTKAARHTAQVLARRKEQALGMFSADAQIAGTALSHSATLVTRNTRDFIGLGLPLLNPFGDLA